MTQARRVPKMNKKAYLSDRGLYTFVIESRPSINNGFKIGEPVLVDREIGLSIRRDLGEYIPIKNLSKAVVVQHTLSKIDYPESDFVQVEFIEITVVGIDFIINKKNLKKLIK